MKKIPHFLRRTYERWLHESADIAFSGSLNAQNLRTRSYLHAENMLTRSLVPIKLGFHESAKSHFHTSNFRGKFKRWFHESAQITLFSCQNEEN